MLPIGTSKATTLACY